MRTPEERAKHSPEIHIVTDLSSCGELLIQASGRIFEQHCRGDFVSALVWDDVREAVAKLQAEMAIFEEARPELMVRSPHRVRAERSPFPPAVNTPKAEARKP